MYFITSRRLEPKRLYDDCIPPNRSGATTDGWKSTVMYGNFITVSIDFWFQPEVQDFLQLVLSTQDQIIKRWNEQLVIGMIRLLFTTAQEEIRFKISYEHGEKWRLHHATTIQKN